ncbi:hypothetical protein F3J42_22795 [Pantoea sp. Ap-959]|uniref:hypothetical protein n=1 Tax=unclassified Pantoea TaxID=2630326 RepID=UPI0011B0DE7A|nr:MULTISPECIES: hypothetical protein [unclassified Pantoea]NIG36694.1 hypothetical protein [Pantoea sp. Ap-959]
MNLIDSHTMDDIAALTRGVYRLRELWLRETRIAGGTWQAAQVRREIVTGGGRVICTLSGDGGLVPGLHPRRRFRGTRAAPKSCTPGMPASGWSGLTRTATGCWRRPPSRG